MQSSADRAILAISCKTQGCLSPNFKCKDTQARTHTSAHKWPVGPMSTRLRGADSNNLPCVRKVVLDEERISSTQIFCPESASTMRT
eukprot:6073816-Amphidinium_carterae.1